MQDFRTALGAVTLSLIVGGTALIARADPAPPGWEHLETICNAEFSVGSDATWQCTYGRQNIAWYSRPVSNDTGFYPSFEAESIFDMTDWCYTEAKKYHANIQPYQSRQLCYVDVRYYDINKSPMTIQRDWFVVGDPIQGGYRDGKVYRVDPVDLTCQCEVMTNLQ